MDEVLLELAEAIRPSLQALTVPVEGRRPSTKEICKALTNAEPVIQDHFGGPLFHRYKGCPQNAAVSFRVDGRPFKILEYLWDFSITRFMVPQAIEARQAPPINGGKFDLLFVAESELGTSTEICRDLLKLALARSKVRCLVYQQARKPSQQRALEARLVRTLHNYAHFADSPEGWMFVALAWNQDPVECVISTLNDEHNAMVMIERPGR